MKTLFMIGWRNIWRHKRRSVVVITSISIGILGMILSMSFLNGMNNQIVENTISTSLGHIAIHRKGFQETRKLEYFFRPSQQTNKAIAKNKLIKSYTTRVKAQAMLRSSEAAIGVMIFGIDPEREKSVSKIYEYTSKDNGSAFLNSASGDSILISKSTAKKLDILLGDKLVLMIQDKNGEIAGVGMTVRGVFQTPVETFDKFVAFTGIKKMQEITGMGADNITEINILLENKKNVDRVKQSLIQGIADPGIEVLSWKDMAPSLVSAIKLFDAMVYIFFAIIFITIIFSITNTLVMSIMERFHEIGVMKSIGTNPSWIFTIVIFEAANLGFVGLALGTATGAGLVGILSRTGINLSFYTESMRLWGTGSIIYPAIKGMDIVAATAIVIATTIIAALYPAFKAARIKPLDALNYI